MAFDLTINRTVHRVDADAQTPLLWVIRDLIGLTGTKFSCGIGQCGACTVHVDGRATRSCSVPASSAIGKPILTIEGLSSDGTHPIQLAWKEFDAPQCGYCQSGTLGAGLNVVRDTGGKPEEFTTLDQAAHEASHRLPHFLPDGSAVLFTVIPYSAVAPDWSRAQVWVKSVKTGERKRLLDDAVDAQYAGNNTLIFARSGKLFAIRFDPSSLSVSGKEVQAVDGVVHSVHGTAGTAWTGAAQRGVNRGPVLRAGLSRAAAADAADVV
jgi:isoquinoline 1-oxidoreductase alpha subunit